MSDSPEPTFASLDIVQAIRNQDVDAVVRLLKEQPSLANSLLPEVELQTQQLDSDDATELWDYEDWQPLLCYAATVDRKRNAGLNADGHVGKKLPPGPATAERIAIVEAMVDAGAHFS